MSEIIISTPFDIDQVNKLKAGDRVYISATIYTARDAAHKRLVEALDRGEELPFDINDSIIYYVGPCPAKPGEVIGSAGPTTSYRMDDYSPKLLDVGLKGMIGKGKRSKTVIEAMIKNKAVYFAAIGGAGALISDSIKEAEIIAYEDLKTEALRKIKVDKFPAIVAIDAYGNNLYECEIEKYIK